MSNDENQKAAQPNPKAAEVNVEARIKEITNVNRIVTNAINLINDVEIKGAHAGPVMEIMGWLAGFSQSLTGQIKTLESTLPKKEEAPKLGDPAKKPELKAVLPGAPKQAIPIVSKPAASGAPKEPAPVDAAPIVPSK